VRHHFNQKFTQEVMGLQIGGSPILGLSGFLTQEFEEQ
jgi:hypothetical protein